ncbi:MAG TPA: hypothetical protein VK403_09295 [Allosphingosinicella sp.]|nr:hypothetical protein [Allosphingosinicella sp.]
MREMTSRLIASRSTVAADGAEVAAARISAGGGGGGGGGAALRKSSGGGARSEPNEAGAAVRPPCLSARWSGARNARPAGAAHTMEGR